MRSRSERRHLESRVLERLGRSPGARFDELWRGLFAWPTAINASDLQMALSELKRAGKVRYVTRTSVPFDPIAQHPGWWPCS
jgi:hypothetical protein